MGTVKHVLRDHWHWRPPVLKVQKFVSEKMAPALYQRRLPVLVLSHFDRTSGIPQLHINGLQVSGVGIGG